MLINNKFNWWIGVVEDRDDPEKLGRVRVRIIGIHSDDKQILPTAQLPWSYILQSPTSAGISGIGTSPLGLLPGSWCIGFFLDSDDMQQPIVMGSIGGIPQQSEKCAEENIQKTQNPPNVLTTEDGSPVLDSQGNPVLTSPEPTDNAAISSTLPPLTEEQIQKLMDAIAAKESSSIPGGKQNYSAVNQYNYIGKYQFGAQALETLGYLKAGSSKTFGNNALNDPSNWTGKDGINSKESFFNSPQVQESIMFQNLKFNYGVLNNKNAITTNDSPERIAGLLASAHLLGAGGAIDLANGKDGQDGNKTSGSSYYNMGASAVGPYVPPVVSNRALIPADKNPSGILNTSGSLITKAFSDPNNQYPKCDYTSKTLPDTNKLAVGDTSDTAVEEKLNSINQIQTAKGQTWEEPPPAYAAVYPYNQTFETEAGHLVEFDSTPGQERIHLYHKAGTYLEIDVNGTMVRKVTGDNYELVENNNYLYVRGGYTLTIEGATQVFIKNDVDLQVLGKTNAIFKDDVKIDVGGNMDLNVRGDLKIQSKSLTMNIDNEYESNAKTFKLSAKSSYELHSGRTSIDGGAIRLNDGAGLMGIVFSAVTAGIALSGGWETLTGELGELGVEAADMTEVLDDISEEMTVEWAGFADGASDFSFDGLIDKVGTNLESTFTQMLTPKNLLGVGVNLLNGNFKGALGSVIGPALNSVVKTVGDEAFNFLKENISLGDIKPLFTSAIEEGTLDISGFSESIGEAFDEDSLSDEVLERLEEEDFINKIDNIYMSDWEESLQNQGITAEEVGIDLKNTSLRDLLKNNNIPLSTFTNAFKNFLMPKPATLRGVGGLPPKTVNRPEISSLPFTLDAGEPGAIAIHNEQIASGEIIESIPIENGEAVVSEPYENIILCDCSEFASLNELPDTAILSRYYTLGDLSSRSKVVKEKVVAQRGLSVSEIVCNLKQLAVNCLDKILDLYPDMVVIDAFRLDTAERISTDHGAGMAADIQFTNANPNDYFIIIQNIAKNVPHKQLLLEYGGGAKYPWIHIAFDVSGQKAPLTYATIRNHQIYAKDKFVNLV